MTPADAHRLRRMRVLLWSFGLATFGLGTLLGMSPLTGLIVLAGASVGLIYLTLDARRYRRVRAREDDQARQAFHASLADLTDPAANGGKPPAFVLVVYAHPPSPGQDVEYHARIRADLDLIPRTIASTMLRCAAEDLDRQDGPGATAHLN